MSHSLFIRMQIFCLHFKITSKQYHDIQHILTEIFFITFFSGKNVEHHDHFRLI